VRCCWDVGAGLHIHPQAGNSVDGGTCTAATQHGAVRQQSDEGLQRPYTASTLTACITGPRTHKHIPTSLQAILSLQQACSITTQLLAAAAGCTPEPLQSPLPPHNPPTISPPSRSPVVMPTSGLPGARLKS
jgi:hypothetical protein